MSGLIDKIGEILVSLGINQTLWPQFIIFLVAFFAMKHIVFNPYLAALEERRRRTIGGEKEAHLIAVEVKKIEDEYRKEARELNEKIKAIYNEQAIKAARDSQSVLAEARQQSDAKIKTGREGIMFAISEARTSMEQHIRSISEKIENKFLRN